MLPSRPRLKPEQKLQCPQLRFQAEASSPSSFSGRD